MNRYLKYSLIGTGAVLGIAVAGAAWLALTFDPNDYKEQIVKAVKESKQRDLRIDGNIALSFYPDIGADIGKVSLSEHNSTRPFAAVESARVSLALMPLFSGRAVVNEITIVGAQATLVRHKDGTTNIDDLLSKDEEASQPVEFDIAAVSVTNTTLGYLDEGSGAQYTAKSLNLHTGRIADGVPVAVDLAARLEASQPKLALDTQLKAALTFDLDQQQFRVQGLDMQAGGSALDIADLGVQARGDLFADLAAQAFGAQEFLLKASGKQGANVFEGALEAPRIEADKQGFKGEKLVLTARLKGVNDIAATLALPSLQGNARVFGSKDLTLTMDAKGEALPGKQVKSEMKGGFAFDADKQHVEVDLAGGLLQSKVKAWVAVDGFDKPAIRFDADVDQFDADLYLPRQPAGTAKAAAEPERPFDLSALRNLNLTGSLRIGVLKAANIKASKVRLDIRARDGSLNVSPLSANLYQGSVSGSLGINAKAVPVFTVKQTLAGIDVAALTKDAAGFDTLEGRGNISMDLVARGNTVGALKKSLDGALTLNLADGAIKGINIAKTLREFGRGTTAKTQEADAAEKTDFSELKASFKVADGIAHNDDLLLKSPLLRLTGNGDIDIGSDRMNYLAKATLAKTLEGQGGKDAVGGITVPVRVSGPFDGLKYTLDFGAMVSESTKQKVEAKKEEVKTKLQDKLKGLFR